jgi:hypothetical protein
MSRNKNDSSLPQYTSERSQIIALLRYALDDVASVSQTSAFVLKMAIQNLEEEERTAHGSIVGPNAYT